jgi:succinate dehydrogenase / fumarate reductase, cytochrome b subunit
MHGVQRPLSPYWIYRWEITMWLSSLHRITGLLLSLGAVVLAAWLVALASGPEAFGAMTEVVGAAWFKPLFVGWAFCFFYHLANGVRHLAWDAGYGFDRQRIRSSGWLVIVVTILATAAFSYAAIV